MEPAVQVDPAVWKAATIIVGTLSSVVVFLFGIAFRGKDSLITRNDSKIELLERQAIERDKEHREREEKLRAYYEAKLEEARKEKSLAVRQRIRTARLAEEALAYQADGTVSDRPLASYDDEDETTEVRSLRAENREDRVKDEIRRRREASRREAIDREARAYVRGESPPPESLPPPSRPPPPLPRFRQKLPSRRS